MSAILSPFRLHNADVYPTLTPAPFSREVGRDEGSLNSTSEWVRNNMNDFQLTAYTYLL